MYLSEYQKARQQGLKEVKLCQSRGGTPYPPVLDEILREEETCGEVRLELTEIPLELIVGTRSAGRSRAFSRSFHPLMEEDSEFAYKWITLCQAQMEEGIHDPIQAYEYMHTFYVVEGHKRVSVLRHFGAVNISAEVTRILPVRNESRASKIYYEYVDFYQLSGVNYLWFSAPGRFPRLQAALGKGPDECWTQDDRRAFFSFYTEFSSLYGDTGAKEMSTRLTKADAILLFLDIFDYEQVRKFTRTQMKEGFAQLRDAFSVKKPLQVNPLKGLLNR